LRVLSSDPPAGQVTPAQQSGGVRTVSMRRKSLLKHMPR
jgi:hypothetical protein